jgi:hypothetical protein
MHYDYIMEGLDGTLATKLEHAVDLLGKDATVATNFVSNLITLPEMTAAGLSPMHMDTLKSEKRAVVYVPDELVEQSDNERCDSDTCYSKIPKSEGRSCSNIAAIYVGERSFDLGAKASNVPEVCGNLCTENFENGGGCRGFEIRTFPDEVVYCILYKAACVLGPEFKEVRAQYLYSADQPGVYGFSTKQIAGGGLGALLVVGLGGYAMSKRKKPFGGKSVKQSGPRYAPI